MLLNALCGPLGVECGADMFGPEGLLAKARALRAETDEGPRLERAALAAEEAARAPEGDTAVLYLASALRETKKRHDFAWNALRTQMRRNIAEGEELKRYKRALGSAMRMLREARVRPATPAPPPWVPRVAFSEAEWAEVARLLDSPPEPSPRLIAASRAARERIATPAPVPEHVLRYGREVVAARLEHGACPRSGCARHQGHEGPHASDDELRASYRALAELTAEAQANGEYDPTDGEAAEWASRYRQAAAEANRLREERDAARSALRALVRAAREISNGAKYVPDGPFENGGHHKVEGLSDLDDAASAAEAILGGVDGE